MQHFEIAVVGGDFPDRWLRWRWRVPAARWR